MAGCRDFIVLLMGLSFCGSLAFSTRSARAQYDSIDAGAEAYQYAEAQRRSAVGAQIGLNTMLRYRVPWSTPYGETIYYPGYVGSAYPHYSVLPPPYQLYPSLFSYSYPTPMIRQPIGQRQEQTGPNRWESYPVYGDEQPPATTVAPAAPTRVEPALRSGIKSPALEAPAAAPIDAPPLPGIPGRKSSGPREF